MKQLDKTIREHAFNSDQMKNTMIHQLHLSKKHSQANHFKFAFVSLSLVVALVMGILFMPNIGAPTQVSAFAMVSVDINPSFELYVDEDKNVIEIKAVNEDALTIETADWIGLPVEEVIVLLIAKAKELGFIDSQDDEDDYILVTTLLLDEDHEDEDEFLDSLGQRIQARIQDAGELEEGMHVAIIKATLREKFEAEGKEIPLGLYVIRGFVEEEGEWVKVSDFVKDQKNVEALEKKSSIMVQKREQAQPQVPEIDREVDEDDDADEDDDDEEEAPVEREIPETTIPETPKPTTPSNPRGRNN